jgi:erythromycin esterase
MKGRKIRCTIAICILASGTLCSQKTNEDLSVPEELIQKIESIDPGYVSTTDIDFLQEEFKGVDIVMMGEQSHGDGSTFRAKTRLIKYLHEEMGFSILVFESGLMDMYRTWTKILGGADSLSVFNYGIFPIWAKSEQVQELFEYILEQSKTDHPLIIAGFDIQPTGSQMTPTGRWEEISSYLERTIDFVEEAYPLFSRSFRNLGSVLRSPLSSEEYDKMKIEYTVLQGKVLESDLSIQGMIYARYIDNYFKTITLYAKADLKKPPNTPHAFNIRDREMARNFELIAGSLYPGEKYIVWGANTHLGYGRGLLDDFQGTKPSAPAMVPFGQYIKIDYQEALYTLAFTSYEGSIGLLRGNERELPKGHELSLEKKLAEREDPFIFLSLKGDQFKSLRFPTRIYGHAEMSGIWGQMADGIFFIKTMEPNKIID